MAESANPTPGATRSPLGSHGDDLARLGTETDGAVRARELLDLAQVALRCDPSLTDRLPFPVPREPNTTTAGALWLGPDEWLVVVAGEATPILGTIREALGGVHHSAVDVSANRAIIELTGAGRHLLLASRCPLDLHPRAWGAGRCAQTLFGRVPIVLEELEDATRLYVRPSFGRHVVDALVDGAGIALGV